MTEPLAAGAKPPLRESLVVLILAGVQFSHIMDFSVMMPLGPQLMRVFGIGAKEFGLVVSVYTFAAAISCFLAALVMDRFDRKKVLITIYSGLVVGTFLCGLAPTFQLLLGARVVTGIFGGLLQAVILSFIGDIVPPERRGRAIGLVMAAFAVASVVGVPIGLAVATAWSWNTVFLGLGVVSAINLGLAARVLPSIKAPPLVPGVDRAGPFAAIGELLKLRNTWVAMGVIVTMMTLFSLFPFISPFLVRIVGVAEGDLTKVYLCGGLASFVISPLAGRLSDRYGVKPVYVIASLLSLPALLILANLGPASLMTAIVLNTTVSAFGAGRMAPAMTLINSSVGRAQRGGFMTLISSVQQISASFWSYAGGWILGSGTAAVATGGMEHFPTLGIVVGIGMVLSTGLALAIRPAAD